jgi:predicted molibdopterin-dependent oxidoreductase YjgC
MAIAYLFISVLGAYVFGKAGDVPVMIIFIGLTLIYLVEVPTRLAGWNNRLTSSHTDSVTHTPAYKEASVRLKVLPEVGESPLPRINHRFGHPTPQNGVEVERKWKRPDYHMPGNRLVQIQTN